MNDHIASWFVGLAKAVAVAALLGGGATVLNNSQDVAVLQDHVQTIEVTNGERLGRIEDKLDRLIERGP